MSMNLRVAEYRTLYKNSKGYHYDWERAHQVCPDEHPKEVYILLINDEYYPLPEAIRIYNKWQEEEYD